MNSISKLSQLTWESGQRGATDLVMSVGLDHVPAREGVGRNLAQRRLARETRADKRLRSGVVLIPGGRRRELGWS